MSAPAATEGVTCPTCYAANPSGRYCAPKRCYCGHEACPAFASFVDMTKVPLPDPEPERGWRR